MMSLDIFKPSIGLHCMVDNGLFDHVLPEIIAMRGVEQPKEYHVKDVLGHTLDVIDSIPKGKTMLRVAGLFHDIGKPSTFKNDGGKITFRGHDDIGASVFPSIGSRIKMSSSDIDFVEAMIRDHLIQYDDSWTDGAVRRFINRVGKERLDDLLMLNEADYEKKVEGASTARLLRSRIDRLEATRQPLTIGIKDLKINGRDVMRILDIPPSKIVGDALNYLLWQVTENPALNEKLALERMVKKNFSPSRGPR
jgi:poly(A) polymerase/tRNA nucleotidyltransferase (CCA-adding enzyme)